jgi:hypothetical protein
MPDIVFARTRHDYGSYADFWKLVELSGFPTCYVDEVDASDASKCYIATPLNGEWQQGWPGARATIIHWDLEWRTPEDYPDIPGVADTWCSDAWYANRINARYVMMGSHPSLARGTPPEPVTIYGNDSILGSVLPTDEYDVAFLAYMTYRRQYLWDRLPVQKSPTSAWGDARHYILTHTKAYLHIHQLDDVRTLPPLRLVVAAAYKLPFITETVDAPGVFADCILQEPYGSMAANIRARLTRADLADFGEALYEKLCVAWTFRQRVEGYV